MRVQLLAVFTGCFVTLQLRNGIEAAITRTRKPTAEPTSVPTFEPSSYAPTTSFPTNPTLSPTMGFSCSAYSTLDTATASKKFGVCYIHACPGETITASGCGIGACAGDQYLKLYDSSLNRVAANDDGGGTCGSCSLLSYTVSFPSAYPTQSPSSNPTFTPSTNPTAAPSTKPSVAPTAIPSSTPTTVPSTAPSPRPSRTTGYPTRPPIAEPTFNPTTMPTPVPSSRPSKIPSCRPSSIPTCNPSAMPSFTAAPSAIPTPRPTGVPSTAPTANPSMRIRAPSTTPTFKPTSSCIQFELHEGCYGDGACSGAIHVTVTTGGPTPAPSLPTCATYSVSNTASASVNYASCYLYACPGSTLMASGCSAGACQGDQYFQLYDTSGNFLTADDDGGGSCGSCSSVSYNISGSSCGYYQLREGCFGSSSCGGTVAISGATVVPAPTSLPTPLPSTAPSSEPSPKPTKQPTPQPTWLPTLSPTWAPSYSPTTALPTLSPTLQPTLRPSLSPTLFPTSSCPTRFPTPSPSSQPTKRPSYEPSAWPSSGPTCFPSLAPSLSPTISSPTISPTCEPSQAPTSLPSSEPSLYPSTRPTRAPTATPTRPPTCSPTLEPTSAFPSFTPTSARPSRSPTRPIPTRVPTRIPSPLPSVKPTRWPSPFPTTSQPVPTFLPSEQATPVVSFVSTISIGGLSTTSFSAACKLALINATASTMGISSSHVLFVASSSQALSWSRSTVLEGFSRMLGTQTVTAKLQTTISLDSFPSSSSPDAVYSLLTNSLNAASSSGALNAKYQSASVALGLNSSAYGGVQSVTNSPLSVVYPPSAPPTAKPTLRPSPRASDKPTVKPTLSKGSITGATIGSFGGFVICLCICCCIARQCTEDESEKDGEVDIFGVNSEWYNENAAVFDSIDGNHGVDPKSLGERALQEEEDSFDALFASDDKDCDLLSPPPVDPSHEIHESDLHAIDEVGDRHFDNSRVEGKVEADIYV